MLLISSTLLEAHLISFQEVELDDSDLATSDGQLKVIGVSKDPENSDLTSANVNFVVTINEHFLKQEAGV